MMWIWCDVGMKLMTGVAVVPFKQEITFSTANRILLSATGQTLLMQNRKPLLWQPLVRENLDTSELHHGFSFPLSGTRE